MTNHLLIKEHSILEGKERGAYCCKKNTSEEGEKTAQAATTPLPITRVSSRLPRGDTKGKEKKNTVLDSQSLTVFREETHQYRGGGGGGGERKKNRGGNKQKVEPHPPNVVTKKKKT